jgi:hypothetical protein
MKKPKADKPFTAPCERCGVALKASQVYTCWDNNGGQAYCARCAADYVREPEEKTDAKR